MKYITLFCKNEDTHNLDNTCVGEPHRDVICFYTLQRDTGNLSGRIEQV